MNPARRRMVGGFFIGLCAPAVLRAGQERWRLYAMEDFPPYSYMSGGRFQGIDVDILDRAAGALGVGLDYVALPWRRAILAFDNSPEDGLFQLTPTAERARKWRMVGPIRDTVIVAVTRVGAPFARGVRLEGLRGLRVGVVRGFTYFEAFDRADHFVREVSPDERVSLRKLVLGRVDVVLMGRANARHVIGGLGMDQALRVLPVPLFREGRYLAFHRNPVGLDRGRRLQRELERLHAGGTVSAILRRYGEDDDAG
ncbi:substrate-binding periplasmic protein [Paenirhodobacter sp.]|uniref:substrate-binding periplasmic protein n=1 Tax=Paenirhodobacter sp. TaxID=1965326 RepID=UPI003B412C9B